MLVSPRKGKEQRTLRFSHGGEAALVSSRQSRRRSGAICVWREPGVLVRGFVERERGVYCGGRGGIGLWGVSGDRKENSEEGEY